MIKSLNKILLIILVVWILAYGLMTAANLHFPEASFGWGVVYAFTMVTSFAFLPYLILCAIVLFYVVKHD